MADPRSPAGRFNPATIALIGAALIAAVAIGIAVFRSDEEAVAPGSETVNEAVAAAPASMADMFAALIESVRRNPDDDQAWFRLGFAYRNNRQLAEAERAFRRASELAPRNADHLAYLGEVVLMTSRETPPPEATALFRRALEIDPANPQARYYLATIRDMGGDHRGAVDDLVALLRSAPSGAPWAPQVRDAVTVIARDNAIDLAGRLPAAPAAPAPSVATAAIPGPTPEQLAAASAIPPSQQNEMGRQMADRLAARLRANPRDEARWIMLMRSRMVLEDPGAAGAALRSALAAFRDDAATQARLRNAARELGVPAA